MLDKSEPVLFVIQCGAIEVAGFANQLSFIYPIGSLFHADAIGVQPGFTFANKVVLEYVCIIEVLEVLDLLGSKGALPATTPSSILTLTGASHRKPAPINRS